MNSQLFVTAAASFFGADILHGSIVDNCRTGPDYVSF